ncbi:MAG: LytTR family transcriptional regulator DNA-binding domain-containing protein [Rubrivivax sp.]|nr:LytTR family transcriptional regulator DNA-binding domain-containing protein [Rubrivivax sp.]
MDSRHPPVSPLYLLERFEAGIVQLDAKRHVVAMNDFARRVLPVAEMLPFDRVVLSFHPERSQAKVEFLFDQAARCPVANPPPMTMIINIPERVLLIKVTRLSDARLEPAGYTLVFYDITELVASDDSASPRADNRRRLLKIPTVSQQRIVLLDVDEVLTIQSDGHYTHVHTAQGAQFCNLNIGDLESRLDGERFMRVHRSHIVNLQAVTQLHRDDGRLALQLGGSELRVPVSRTSAAALLARLGLPN